MYKKSDDRKRSLMDTLDKIFKAVFALLCAAGVEGSVVADAGVAVCK